MFITNGDEIINLEFVRVMQVFDTGSCIIRLWIDEHQFILLRFDNRSQMSEAADELIEMLQNISEHWKAISSDVYVRSDKLRHAKGIGSELTLNMDTGCIKLIQKPIYETMNNLTNATGAVVFGEEW